MPRNDQTIRHWYLLRRLESTRGVTLQELAESIPEDYGRHPRTIRRDLEALEVCFPIYTERIDGQTRWKLVDGYGHVPALAFSPTELMALVFSRDLLKPLDGTQIGDSLDSALEKVAAALPTEGEAYVRQMQGFFSVGHGPHKAYRQHKATIEQLSRAITRNRTVQMRYYSASHNSTRRRDADPYRLWYAAGALYLVAHCHLRREVRLFSVDRIRSLALTNRPCQMPLGFDLETYVQDALVVMRGEPIDVELLFDRKTAAWVKDRQWHPTQQVVLLKNGQLGMKLRIADTRELLGWILSFGAGVHVVSPEVLRAKIRQELEEILRRD